MYPFLHDFEQVSIEEFHKKWNGDVNEPAKLYCLDEDNQLTGLMVKSVSNMAFLEHLPPINSLTWLVLQNCQLTVIPDIIVQCAQLKFIDLEDNAIDKLPANFGDLSQLNHLFLADNKIQKLPISMAQLNDLIDFGISHNPITNNIHDMAHTLPPAEKIAYLLEIQKPETKTLNEAKVLVLGDERVGKTSLINRIIGREMDEQQKTTLGIDIQQHPLSNGININIWDFAGQEITHQTHQFFLSHRSLYLLVLDGQKQDNDSAITEWLNTIKAISDNAPIVVVINKCDLNPGYKFDEFRFGQAFNIVKVLYTSAAAEAKIDSNILSQINHSIDDLVSVIEQQIEQIKEVKLPFPPSWLAVKNELEDKQKADVDFIESVDYERICESHGVNSENLQNALLSILNQIGTIVTYKEHQRLNVMQIINPAWVTNGVYKVLRSPLIGNTEATLNEAQFRQIFCDERKYSKSRHYTWLIDLLKQFRLAFSIDDHRVLLPSRLETTQPPFNWSDYQQGLNFRFLYEGILKKGILSQLIVLKHQYVTVTSNAGSDSAADKYWQRGVFLSHENANGVVVSDEDKKTITIAIDQANRAGRELLTIIRHAIREINGPELDVEEQVPLLADKTVLGFESFDAIVDAEQQGGTEYRAKIGKKAYKTFKIAELLDGYRIKDDPSFDYNRLTKDLFEISCIETENRHAICDEKEDLTNDRFKTALLNRHYRVSDQSRGGESGSGLSAGERDLLIRNSQTDVAECVIEAFVLKNHDTKVITEHLKKLVENYDTTGNQHNYAISYVKSARFYALWHKYQQLIPNFEDTSDKSGKKFVLTARSTHGPKRFERTVNHLFINFYSGELKE